MSNNWRNICCPSLKQSGCILFGMHECYWSPLGEGELHWISAQLENCPVSSSSAVKWTFCIWYSKLYELRWNDETLTENWKTILKYLKRQLNTFECNAKTKSLMEAVMFCSIHIMFVYIVIDWSQELAVSYKLCVSTSAYHAALTLSWFWCRDGITGQFLEGCERAVDSGGLLQCSVGGNTHQCPQQPKSSPTILE